MKRRTFLKGAGALAAVALAPTMTNDVHKATVTVWEASAAAELPISARWGEYLFILHPDWVAELKSSGVLEGISYLEVEHLTGFVDNPALLK